MQCLKDGDMRDDNYLRIEPKRYQPELLFTKRQEIEAVSSIPRSGISNGSISLWDNALNLQSISGKFSGCLFGSELVRTSNPIDRNTPNVGMGNLNMEVKGFEDQFRTHSSVSLSLSHESEDPSLCISYGGIRKVKVNQSGDSENCMPVSNRHSYCTGNHNISIGAACNMANDSISRGPTYNRGEENTISLCPTFTKTNDNFVSTSRTFNKGDGSFMLMGHNFYKSYDNSVSVSHPFDKGCALVSAGQELEEGNGNIISAGHAHNKGRENFISMLSTYGNGNGNSISVGCSFDKGNGSIIWPHPTSDEANKNVLSMGTNYKEGYSGNLSTGQSYEKGETGGISFGYFQSEPETNSSGGITSGYYLMANQPFAQTSKPPGMENSSENNTGPSEIVAPGATSKTKVTPKSKEPKSHKKVAADNFPSNVKSLLSTGMLDGVPVKYVSWSREHSLKGIVKGSGYLCGCTNCKFSKPLNAYELERHAGCKTKHPNNHIYFENGKTIYAVVQELKSTPQDMLFEMIQKVTGSPIHQKNFLTWKASYQAATRERQRIYGKDELIVAS